MASGISTRLAKLAERRLLSRLARAADQVDHLSLPKLRARQAELRPLVTELSRFTRAAEERLAGSANAIRKPRGTDWAYRPQIWRQPIAQAAQVGVCSGEVLDEETKLFHDCPDQEIILRQSHTCDPDALSPYDLRLEVLHFQGSFLSISCELPPDFTVDLQSDHVVEVTTTMTCIPESEAYLRLNLHQDQEVKQVLRKLENPNGEAVTEFDLAYEDIQTRLLDKAWLDVIFSNPAMSSNVISDLTLTRRRRADF